MNPTNHRFGLLGERISSSLSPALFQWAMRRMGLSGSYGIYDFPKRLARTFIAKTRNEWTGLNVTTPHKDLAFELVNSISERAAITRSVNTLLRKDGDLRGENTDVAGFAFALKRRLPERSQPRTALVIGTGGAARACICAIMESLPTTEIHVATRRTASAVNRLTSLIQKQESITILTQARAARRLPEYDLIVQATPVGSFSLPGYPLPPPLNFRKDALVMDLIYAPRETLFLEAAGAFGAATENGLVMLIAQGAESFQLWTGLQFPMDAALEELLPEFQKR